MRRILSAALIAVAVAASSACTAARPVIYTAPSLASSATTQAFSPSDEPLFGSDRHVIVVSIDGLRPDAIEKFNAVHLKKLLREGRYSLNAKTIMPSLTLPSHTSMLTGVEPATHGIEWNSNRVHEHGTVEVPTIFRLAREHGLQTAAFASKGKFNHLFVPGSVDHFVVPEGNGSWSSGRTASEMGRYFEGARPNLTFVHLREPDRYGHVFGWMGRVYGWAVRRADAALGEVIASADRAFGEGEYTLIVTSDHGGHGRTHGTDAVEDVTIPWIVWGKGVEGHGETSVAIHTTDTAATALWLLGISLPADYQGAPVRTVFDPATRNRKSPVFVRMDPLVEVVPAVVGESR